MIKRSDILPNSAIVVFNYGAFGGAALRYTRLFLELNNLYPGKWFFIVNSHLLKQVKLIFKDLPFDRILLIDENIIAVTEDIPDKTPAFYPDNIANPLEIDKNASFFRKIYWYYKNKFRQKSLFKKIEKFRKEKKINVFIGVFSGILPLIFYLTQSPRKASVIFADMDSWFSDVLPDMNKLWYRKYYSFNYALENSDYVDFLSPYILDGIQNRNINIKKEAIAIAPCSFSDYSKCIPGNKTNFAAVFCARMEPEKNPLLYLEAAREILKKYPSVKFHILGEGTLVKEVQSFINKNKLSDSINFQFHTSPPEIFAETSVFVSLQSNTNYPSQSVLEAMACGNAIIASNTGDTNLFINSNNGMLIDLNIKSLITALEKLIHDRELTKNLGINAREYAITHHTKDKYIEYFADLVQKANKKNFG